MAALRLILGFLSLFVISSINAHNITEILSAYPDYSQFNSYLSQTKLADEINSRETITVLVLNNAAMATLTAKHPLSVIKNELSLHVLLDYYDPQKLHSVSNGTTLTTTLYQTTGNAPGNLGFVNITDLKGGVVGFGSAVPGSKLDSTYIKSVKQIPYNISVLEINAPIIAQGILTAPAPSASAVNVTALLEKAGCKTFEKLIVSSGVLKIYQSQMDKGLTIFAPTDEAFTAKGLPDLSKLSSAELVSLLQYHALNSYTPKGTLKATKDPISTLATSGAGKYDLTTTTSGDDVTLLTGVDSSRISRTLLDSTPIVIFTIDRVLLPEELFGKSPSPSPAPAPETVSPSPTPVSVPTPAPASLTSPPAPATGTHDGAPAEAPAAKSENSTSDNSTGLVKPPALMRALLLVSGAIALVFMS